MALFNIFYGQNPDAGIILKFLRLKIVDFHRFRDVNVESDDDRVYIVVLVKVDRHNDFSMLPYYTVQVADREDTNYIYISFDVTDHPQVEGIREYIRNDDRLIDRMSPERWEHATNDIIDRIQAGEDHPLKKIIESMACVKKF